MLAALSDKIKLSSISLFQDHQNFESNRAVIGSIQKIIIIIISSFFNEGKTTSVTSTAFQVGPPYTKII